MGDNLCCDHLGFFRQANIEHELTMNSDGIYYPFEVLIVFNKKAIKLQSVINYITIHCDNTSKGIRIKILVTSSGNIRNQLVYVANHNKTFERHVQVSSFIW